MEASADTGVRPADLFAVAADLRNLPAWWIEHLSAEVEVPAVRLRDSVHRVRYRLPGGFVVSALCTVVAARGGRSLTYVWEGGGIRMAVGQSFVAHGEGARTRLIVDLNTDGRVNPVGSVVVRLMGRGLDSELERALATLAELAAARAVVRRAPLQGGAERRAPGSRPAVSVLGAAAGAAGGGAATRARSGLAAGGGGAATRGGRGGPTGAGRGRRGGGATAAPTSRRRPRLPLDPGEHLGGAAGGAVDEKKKVARRRPRDVGAPGAAAESPEA